MGSSAHLTASGVGYFSERLSWPTLLGMHGKTCLVTGASTGIGKETALGLARLGATVALVCRDRAKGEAAVAAVQQAGSGRPAPLFLADLSSMVEVRRVASEIRQQLP